MKDLIWVLESNKVGYKVVWCNEKPSGGYANANYLILADGLTRFQAEEFARKMRNS